MVFRTFLFALIFPAFLSAANQNLLLITIDTLRADHLGCYGNATIQNTCSGFHCAKSLFFENAICAAHSVAITYFNDDRTLSDPSWYPRQCGDAFVIKSIHCRNSESQRIFTYAFVSGFPLEHRFGLNQGFDVYNDEFRRTENALSILDPNGMRKRLWMHS